MGERRVQRSDDADEGEDISRTVNSQFGYQHKVQKDTTIMIKKLKMFNVFDPICRKCVKMGQQQSCREVSCHSYHPNRPNGTATYIFGELFYN